MYAKLAFNSDAVDNRENILSDIVDVLTGETDLNNLISDINIANSFIDTSSSAAGWTLWDDISENEKVIRAPYTEYPTRYKYVHFNFHDQSGGHKAIAWQFYRDWDEVSHTGTINRRINSSTSVLSDTTNGNYIYYGDSADPTCIAHISASSAHLACINVTRNGVTTTGAPFLSERTRESKWDTLTNGISPVLYSVYPMHQNTWTAASGIYRAAFNCEQRYNTNSDILDVNDDTGTSVVSVITTSIGSTQYSSNTTGSYSSASLIKIPRMVADDTLELKRPLIGFGGQETIYGDYGGDVSNYSKIYLTYGFGETGDILLVNTDEYVIWVTPSSLPTSSPSTRTDNYRLAVRKG